METKEIKVIDTTSNTETSLKNTANPKKSTLGNSVFGTLNYLGFAKIQNTEHQQTTMKDKVAALWNKLNKKEELEIFDEKGWCTLIKDTFGLEDSEVGNRGPKWDSLESRQRYKVFVDGVAFEPEFTAKQKAKLEEVEHSVPAFESNVGQAIVPPQTPQAIVPETPKAIVPEMPQAIVPETPQAIVPTAIVPETAVADISQAMVPPKEQVELNGEELSYVDKMKGFLSKGTWTTEQLITSLSKKIGVEKATMILSLAQ